MEITWDRIQALGERLDKSRDLEVAMVMGSDHYVVFTPGPEGTVAYGRTHNVITKGPWDLECDCPDFEFNGHLNGGFCKHVMGVLAYRGQHPVIVRTTPDRRDEVPPSWKEGDPPPPIFDPDDLEAKIEELY